jgi:hypothetical protein
MDAKVPITLIDDGGRLTRMRVEMPGLDAASILAAAATLVGHLDAASNLGVVKADVQFPLTGVASAAAAGSNTDVGGKARGISDGDGDTVVLRLPDPVATAINADYTIDLTEINIDNFISHFETGGDAMLSDGEQVASWRYAVLDSR